MLILISITIYDKYILIPSADTCIGHEYKTRKFTINNEMHP